MTTRAEFVAYVRSMKGTPVHHQGRVPGVGLDCPGPVICGMWHFHIKPRSFDVVGYPAIPDGVSIKGYLDEHLEPVSQSDMRPADVVLVAWQKGPPQHMGVVVDYPGGGLAMVHADSVRARKVSETRIEFGRAMRFVAAYAVPGLVD
jgi:cell wall-associated NlpC family hydrolase